VRLWIRDILWRVRRRGLVGTILGAAKGIPRSVMRALYLRREAYITYTDISALPPPAPGRDPTVRAFLATPADLERLEEAVGPARCETFRRRMGNGQALVLGEADGRVVGYCALAFEPTYARESDCVVPVGEGEAYGHGAFTLPEYRRRGVYAAMLDESTRVVRERGICRVYGAVSVANPAARAALRRLRARAAWAAGSIRVLGFTRHWQRELKEGERL